MDHRTVRALKKKASPRQVQCAKLLAEGKPVGEALRKSGYSESSALRGMGAVSKTVLALLPESVPYVELGRAVTAEQQEAAIRGRLFSNVIKGVDKAVNSSYRLGQDKRVNMFQADTQVGIIMVNAPESAVKQLPVPEDEK